MKTTPIILALLAAALLAPHAHADLLSPANFHQWGSELLQRLDDDFLRYDNLYRNARSQSWPAYAWAQGIMLSANTAAARVDPARIPRARIHAQAIRNQYRCYANNLWAYNASANSCGDRYYDDNAWIALALLELHQLTDDPQYLDWARETLAFCMSGENGLNDSPNGGIRWHESNTSGASVCATAPTILANFITYQLTGIESYNTDGQRLYHWIMASNLRYPSGIFHETNQGPLGYQTAVMTQAALQLHRITDDPDHLAEAQRMAAAMGNLFIDHNSHALNHTGKWGGHDMTNAYVDLYEIDADPHWLELAAAYLQFLYVNCPDPATGLYPVNWNDASRENISNDLLENASVARAFCKMASAPATTTTPFQHFTPTLRARYLLDESTGTTAADSSGFQRHATLHGFSFDSAAAPGQLNSALTLDGLDDHLQLPAGLANFRNGLTLSIWACPTAASDWARFFDLGNGEYDNNIVFARHGASNDLFFETYENTSSGGHLRAPAAIALDQWQLFTATLEPTGHATLYKNASPIATGTIALPDNIQRLYNYIGRSNWTADNHFQGLLDDARIYNYALDPDQVAALYLGGQAENPYPAHNARDLPDILQLAWTPNSLALSHDLYLGHDPAALAVANIDSPEYLGRHSQTSFSPALDQDATYFWRVDEVAPNGAIVIGRIWTFATAPAPTRDLLLHYNMDDTFRSGASILDAAPDRPLAAHLLGPATGVPAPIGQAIRFDGANDYLDLPDGFDDFSKGLTVSLWARPTSAANWARFLDLGNGPYNNNIVLARQQTSTTLSFEAYNGPTSGGKITAPGAIALNQWQMFTATIDLAGYARLYKNGLQIAHGQTALPPTVTRTNNYIGKSNWPDAYYRGDLDDFAIWSRTLAPAEIAALYQRGLAGRPFADAPDPFAPAARWPLNEATGLTAHDLAGHDHHGQLTNMAPDPWSPGKQCSALAFDGLDDHLRVPGLSGIVGPASRTCSAWIKTTANANAHILTWGSTEPGRQWLFRVQNTGQLAVGIYGGYVLGGTPVNDGNWHHVAAVLLSDSATTLDDIRLYVDGQLEQYHYVSANQTIDTAAAQDLLIGIAVDSQGDFRQPFQGIIDEPTLHPRALNENEILNLYRNHALLADHNHDSHVDLKDFANLAQYWLSTNPNATDLNCDNQTNLPDLLILLQEYLNPDEGPH